MPPVNLWRDLARKAAQALRRQLAQTEQGLASILNPARSPRPIPVPLPRRRAPRFPGDKRFYTQSASPGLPVSRSSGSTSITAKTQFGRTLTRPRLTSGTTRSQGYGRSFSTAPVNHAQVAREVYQSISLGIRAGVLNTPYYPPPTGQHAGHVLCGVRSAETVQTMLNIPLCPSIMVASQGTLSHGTVAELEGLLCTVPQFLAKLRRDLHKLMRNGSFDYKMVNNDTEIQIIFHGRYREDVERFLGDIGVTSGTVTQSLGLFENDEAQEVNWTNLFRGKYGRKTKSIKSLENFVDEVDRTRRIQVVQ